MTPAQRADKRPERVLALEFVVLDGTDQGGYPPTPLIGLTAQGLPDTLWGSELLSPGEPQILGEASQRVKLAGGATLLPRAGPPVTVGGRGQGPTSPARARSGRPAL